MSYEAEWIVCLIERRNHMSIHGRIEATRMLRRWANCLFNNA